MCENGQGHLSGDRELPRHPSYDEKGESSQPLYAVEFPVTVL